MYETLHNECNGSVNTSQRSIRLVEQNHWTQMEWKIPWRSIHVLISILTIVVGFCTFMPLSYVSKYFLNQCLLYANIDFLFFAENSSAVVNFPLSVWGTQMQCSYVTFTSVTASIHAFVWGWFFLLMKQAFHRKNREFSLLIPCLLFHAGFFIAVFVSSCYINEGIDVWCKNFYKQINAFPTKQKMTCPDSQDIYWNIFTEKHSFYSLLFTARISTWLLTLCVLLQCVVCVYQMYTGIREEMEEQTRKIRIRGFDNEAYMRQISRSDEVGFRYQRTSSKRRQFTNSM